MKYVSCIILALALMALLFFLATRKQQPSAAVEVTVGSRAISELAIRGEKLDIRRRNPPVYLCRYTLGKADIAWTVNGLKYTGAVDIGKDGGQILVVRAKRPFLRVEGDIKLISDGKAVNP